MFRKCRIAVAATLIGAAGVLLWQTAPTHAFPPPAQRPATMQPAKGRFLVAVRELRDPNFAQTVILLTKYGEDGAMGLIVNRPTNIRLGGVLELEGVEKRPETIFIGGPVERSAVLLLARSETPPEKSESIFGDVYLSANRALLEKYIAGPAGDERFRLYSGYSGWAAGQLDFEMERGSWHVFPADADTVFSTRPSTVWERWIERTEMRFAMGLISPRGVPGCMDHPEECLIIGFFNAGGSLNAT